MNIKNFFDELVHNEEHEKYEELNIKLNSLKSLKDFTEEMVSDDELLSLIDYIRSLDYNRGYNIVVNVYRMPCRPFKSNGFI